MDSVFFNQMADLKKANENNRLAVQRPLLMYRSQLTKGLQVVHTLLYILCLFSIFFSFFKEGLFTTDLSNLLHKTNNNNNYNYSISSRRAPVSADMVLQVSESNWNIYNVAQCISNILL